jgi:hypothetical protein
MHSPLAFLFVFLFGVWEGFLYFLAMELAIVLTIIGSYLIESDEVGK